MTVSEFMSDEAPKKEKERKKRNALYKEREQELLDILTSPKFRLMEIHVPETCGLSRVLVHRSTREGVLFQLSKIDLDGIPKGHIDFGPYDQSIIDMVKWTDWESPVCVDIYEDSRFDKEIKYERSSFWNEMTKTVLKKGFWWEPEKRRFLYLIDDSSKIVSYEEVEEDRGFLNPYQNESWCFGIAECVVPEHWEVTDRKEGEIRMMVEVRSIGWCHFAGQEEYMNWKICDSVEDINLFVNESNKMEDNGSEDWLI